jgi:hypothetical protein
MKTKLYADGNAEKGFVSDLTAPRLAIHKSISALVLQPSPLNALSHM